MVEPTTESPSALATSTEEPTEQNEERPRTRNRRKRTRENEDADCRDLTLSQIISRLKQRGDAKPMPSAVRRTQERRERRRRGENVEEAPDTAAAPPTPPPEESEATQESGVVAPQVTFDEDGNIVIDQASLVVSANAHPEEEGEREVTTVENHVFSSKVTSLSFKKREKSTRWTEEDTEKFYTALAKYGSDFSLIEREIPTRTRKQLKAKYKREERLCPDRITMAITRKPLPPLPPRRVVGRPRKQTPSGQNAKETQSTQPDQTQNNLTQQSSTPTAPAEPTSEQPTQKNVIPPAEGNSTENISQPVTNETQETVPQRESELQVSQQTVSNNAPADVTQEKLPEKTTPTKPDSSPSNQNNPSEAVNDQAGSPAVQKDVSQEKEIDNNPASSNNCSLPSESNIENNQETTNEASASANPTLETSATNDAQTRNENSNDVSHNINGDGIEKSKTITSADTENAEMEDPSTKDTAQPGQNNGDNENENQEEKGVSDGLDKDKGVDGAVTEVVGRLDDDDEEHNEDLDIMLGHGGFDSDDSEMNDGSGYDSD